MSLQGKLLAVQLANQHLGEAHEKMQSEVVRLSAENADLEKRNAQLQRELNQAQKLYETLKAEYRRSSGRPYQGRSQITKFGFQRSA